MRSLFKAFFLMGFLAFFTSFPSAKIYAQGYANNVWYFGNSASAIKFNKGSDRSIFRTTDQATPFGQMGSAVATDPNTGQLIFYTDGLGLYDQNHQLITNFANGNNIQSQPVAICHVPDSTDLYYIFTKDAANTLFYHVVKHQDSTIVIRSLDQPTAVTNTTEALLMLAGGSVVNPNYWLLMQSGAELKSFQIGADIDDPISETGTIPISFNLGNIAYRPDTINNITDFWLGLASSDLGINVHLVNFDAFGGGFSNIRAIPASNSTDRRVADVEWSNDGRKLYFSRSTTNGGMLFQFNTDPKADPTTAIQSVLNSEVGASHGLQMGPDGNLYHLYQRQGQSEVRLASIAFSDSLPDSLVYDVEVFNNVNFNGRQFPQFLPPKPSDVNIEINVNGVACQNQPVVLSTVITNDLGEEIEPEQYFWNINNGAITSNAISPVVTFPDAVNTPVALTVMVNGLPHQSTINVPVTIFDVRFSNFPPDTTVCQLPLTFTAEIEGNAEIFWSNNTTLTPNPEGTFTIAGTYWAIADDGFCQTSATLPVYVYGEPKTSANIWYFGNNAGIDFNDPDQAVALDNSIMQAPEGCATICFKGGQPLFYTDGETVYAITDKVNNTGHVVMQNGDSIGGDPGSLQSALIVQFPDDETQFYIFTTKEVPNDSNQYVLSYSIVDIKENGGLGAVIAKNIPMMVGCTESVTATGTSGSSVNLYAHELGTNVFRVFPITAQGIGAPSFFTAGSIIDESTVTGYMELGAGANGQIIAQALSNDGNELVELHMFDTLGNYTDTYTLTLQAPVGRIYGLEMSSNKLLATVSSPGNSQIYEFRIDSLDEAYMNTTFFVHGPFAAELGAIQNAPNGQTYVAVNGATSLGVLGIINSVFNFPAQSRSTFTLSGFALAGGTSSQLGLPNYIDNDSDPILEPGIYISPYACVGDQFDLESEGSSNFDTYEWQVTDPNGGVVFTSFLQDTLYRPSLPGVYTARLTIRNECLLPGNDIVGVFIQDFEAFPSPVVNSDDFFLCDGEATIGVPALAGHTYTWLTGQTGSLITVTEEGDYFLTVTNANNCSAEARMHVGTAFDVDLGDDLTVCPGVDVELPTQVSGASFQWFVNNTLQVGENGRTFVFNNSVGGEYIIRVEVADPADPSCIVSSNTRVTVTELEVVATSSPSTCAANNGTIDLDITAAPGFTVLWGDGITTEDRTGLRPGTYDVEVNANGCIRYLSVPVNSTDGPDVTGIATSPVDCAVPGTNGIIEFEIDLTSVTLPLNLTYSLSRNGASFETNKAFILLPDNTFKIQPLPSGNYTLTVTDNNGTGCSFSEGNIVVPEADQIGLKLFFDNGSTQTEILPADNFVTICGAGSVITQPTNSATVSWTSTGPYVDLAANNGNLILEAPRDYGTHTYTALASTGGVNPCDTLREVVISFLPVPSFEIEAEIQCDGSVLLKAVGLSAAPVGTSYNYRWSRSGAQIGSADSILITQEGTYNGADFELLVRYNENLSCSFPRNPIGTFTVTGPLSVSLASSPACDDGEPIVLTANTNTLVGISFTWRNPSGAVISGANGPEIEVMDEGTYSVEVKRTGGNADCAETATYLLDRLPIPVTDLESRILFCETVPSLDPGVFESYLWTFPDGTTNTAQAIDVLIPGTYSVDITLNGCTVTEEVIAILDCKPLVVVANAIKPTSKNGNESFKVLFTEYVVDFNVFIYNRWGELVFQSNSLDFEWNGTTSRGDSAPNGTYAYIMKYKSETNPERGIIEQRGAVTLLR